MSRGANEAMAVAALEHGKAANAAMQPGRLLESVALRPGISIYLGGRSYVDSTLHKDRHPWLRMYDAGPICLLQALDDAGKVVDEAEVLWHSVWWRKVSK